ncbi:MAG: hypothetical protein Q4B96_00005, partial [Bacillota bacterium]|nr:hypothetical protein [Bacillota bacterium]
LRRNFSPQKYCVVFRIRKSPVCTGLFDLVAENRRLPKLRRLPGGAYFFLAFFADYDILF